MKRPSEGEFGKALRAVDGLVLEVYKPPDDARLWKPCDYMVWFVDPVATPDGGAAAAWFEVKDMTAAATFPRSELRPAQLQGIRAAERVGMPYWLAIYWRKHQLWTISDAIRVVRWFESGDDLPGPRVTSIPLTTLESRFGISSSKQQLSSTLKGVLLGEVD